MPSRTYRPALVVAALALSAVACSERKRKIADVPQQQPFDEIFHRLDNVKVTLAASDTLGLVSGVGFNTDRIFIADLKKGELRAFRRSDGSAQGTVAHPGDGSGDLRSPASILTLDSSRIAVFDNKRHLLSVRDSLGRLVTEVHLGPIPPVGGQTVLRDEHRILFAGSVYPASEDTKARDLHEFDWSGKRVRSYGRLSQARSRWEQAYPFEFVAIMGNHIVTGAMNSRRLRLYDRTTGKERWIDVLPGWPAIQWPSDRLLQRGVGQQTVATRIIDWEHQQRLMNGVFPIGNDRLVVRFQGFDGEANRYFNYVVIDTGGRTIAVTDSTRVRVVDVRGDTLYWLAQSGARQLAAGTAILTVRRAEGDSVRTNATAK